MHAVIVLDGIRLRLSHVSNELAGDVENVAPICEIGMIERRRINFGEKVGCYASGSFQCCAFYVRRMAIGLPSSRNAHANGKRIKKNEKLKTHLET